MQLQLNRFDYRSIGRSIYDTGKHRDTREKEREVWCGIALPSPPTSSAVLLLILLLVVGAQRSQLPAAVCYVCVSAFFCVCVVYYLSLSFSALCFLWLLLRLLMFLLLLSSLPGKRAARVALFDNSQATCSRKAFLLFLLLLRRLRPFSSFAATVKLSVSFSLFNSVSIKFLLGGRGF